MKLRPIKYALGQIDVVPGRPDINVPRIIKESIAAAKCGVNVIVFPEMCVSGYLLGDKFNSNGFALDIMRYNHMIVAVLAAYNIVVIFGSFAVDTTKVNENGRYRKYNAAFVAQKGRLIANDVGLSHAIKTLFPNYRIFDDARYFFCLRKYAMETKRKLKALLKPFTVTINGQCVKLGVMLCEDMWDIDYAQKPARILKKNGADILINLSASNWSWQKNRKRHEVVRDLIRQVQLPMLYVNNVGCQNNGKNFIPFDGSSTMYNACGQIVHICNMYQDKVVDVTLEDSLPEVQVPVVDDVAQMYLAIKQDTLGYFRTTLPQYAKKIVIGLSGGMDSALSAAFFVRLFGADRVILVNMPYKDYNSTETRGIAKTIAENLGVTDYRVVSIDAMVDADASTNGVAEGTSQHKSIQATMRLKVLATIASKVGGTFICNANKTEIAFGYGTLLGDLRGYFAPWMDALKGEVYQLADYMNRVVYGRTVIPEECFTIEPMDELVKGGSGVVRKDPFDYGHVHTIGYHDAMVRSLTELQKEPEWFLEQYMAGTLEKTMLLPEGKIAELFSTPEAFILDLKEKMGMFIGAIHKRVQSVPGAHFSRASFGWDFREYLQVVASDNQELAPYYSLRFKELEAELLTA